MNANKQKLNLITIAFSITILIFASRYLSSTTLPTDPYWGYQAFLLSREVLIQPGFAESPVPSKYIINLVNHLRGSLASPLLIVIIHEVLGIGLINAYFTPALGVGLVIIIAAICRRFRLFPGFAVAAVILAVVTQFSHPHIAFTLHRGGVGWVLLFTLIWLILYHMYTQNHHGGVVIAVLVVGIVFVMSDRTNAISSLIFFGVINISAWVSDQTKSYFLIILATIAFSYHMYVSSFITNITSPLRRISQLSYSIDSPLIFLTPGSALPTPKGLDTVQLSGFTPPSWYIWSTRYIRSVALLSFIALIIYLGYTVILNNGNSYTSTSQSQLLIGLTVWLTITAVITPFIGGTSGANPMSIGFFFSPIYIPMVVYILTKRIRPDYNPSYRAITIILTILLISSPAVAVLFASSETPHAEFRGVNAEDRASAEWCGSYIGTLGTDFRGASNLMTVNGVDSFYLPRSGSPAWTTSVSIKRIIRTYYTSSAESYERNADGVYVTRKMQKKAVVHRQNLKTMPTPHLPERLSHDGYNIIYTAGTAKCAV